MEAGMRPHEMVATMTSLSLFQGQAAFVARTGWPAVGALFAGLGIVGAAVVTGGAASIGCMVQLGLPLPRGLGAVALSQDSINCQLAGLVAQQIVFIALTLVAAGFFSASRRDALALYPPNHGTVYVTGALLMVPAVVLYTLLVWLMSPADLIGDLNSLLPIIRSDALWLTLLAIGIGAPLSEELLFRGFLLPAFARSPLGFSGAAFVTTAAWTALHFSYSVFGLLEVFLIGLYFSWLLWRTGSLWVPIVCHAVYNTTVLLGLRYLPLPI